MVHPSMEDIESRVRECEAHLIEIRTTMTNTYNLVRVVFLGVGAMIGIDISEVV